MCPSLSLSNYAADSAARRRRLSVAPAAPRRLVGWCQTSHSQQIVVEQAKNLCSKFLRCKLRNCALLHKKPGLQRLKSLSTHDLVAEPWPSSEIAAELRDLGAELEQKHPELFLSVLENVGLNSLQSERAAAGLLSALAEQLCPHGQMSWGRIAALYAVTGALAVDCVKLGRPDFLLALVQAVGACAERDLGNWIVQQGGWTSLLTRFRKSPSANASNLLFSIMVLVAVAIFIYYILP